MPTARGRRRPALFVYDGNKIILQIGPRAGTQRYSGARRRPDSADEQSNRRLTRFCGPYRHLTGPRPGALRAEKAGVKPSQHIVYDAFGRVTARPIAVATFFASPPPLTATRTPKQPQPLGMMQRQERGSARPIVFAAGEREFLDTSKQTTNATDPSGTIIVDASVPP